MPNQRGILRGPGSQRADRTSVDTGTGVKRVSDEGRARHVDRGMFVNKQKDLGINTTEAHADLIREEERKFQEAAAAEEKALGLYQSAYDDAMKQLGVGFKDLGGNSTALLEKAWGTAYKSFVPVRFMGEGDEVLRTVMMPKEAIPEAFVGKKGIWASQHGNYWNVAMKEVHHTQKLAEEAMRSVEHGKSEWMAKRAPEAGKTWQANMEILRGLKGEFAGYGAQIDARRGLLQGERDNRAKMWANVRGDQAKRIATMKEIFMKFKAGGD